MGGVYCENCDISPLLPKKDEPKESIDFLAQDVNAVHRAGALGVMPYAVDPEAAKRLWSVSEQLVF
jgi:hypothetical protein